MNCVSCIICRAHVSYVVLFLVFCPLCVGFFSFSVFFLLVYLKLELVECVLLSNTVESVVIGVRHARVCAQANSRECCNWGSVCACVMCAGDM